MVNSEYLFYFDKMDLYNINKEKYIFFSLKTFIFKVLNAIINIKN